MSTEMILILVLAILLIISVIFNFVLFKKLSYEKDQSRRERLLGHR